MITVVTYRIGQELPSLPLNWEDSSEMDEALASGWTGRVDFSSIDYPLVKIGSGVTTVTLADTDPNFLVAWGTSVWADLVTSWGKTLPEQGHRFRIWPRLTSSGASNYEWPDDNVLIALVKPALA